MIPGKVSWHVGKQYGLPFALAGFCGMEVFRRHKFSGLAVDVGPKGLGDGKGISRFAFQPLVTPLCGESSGLRLEDLFSKSAETEMMEIEETKRPSQPRKLGMPRLTLPLLFCHSFQAGRH